MEFNKFFETLIKLYIPFIIEAYVLFLPLTRRELHKWETRRTLSYILKQGGREGQHKLPQMTIRASHMGNTGHHYSLHSWFRKSPLLRVHLCHNRIKYQRLP